MRILVLVIALIVVLAVGLVWLAGSGVLAQSVRAAAVAHVSQALGRQVRVTRIAGDPVRGIVLDGVRIAAPPGERGTFFAVNRIALRFRPLTLLVDLLRGRGPAASLATIELHRPVLALSRDSSGRWNYPHLPPQTARAGRSGFTGTIDVREGTLIFSDTWEVPAPFTAHFERLTGTISWSDAPRVRVEADAINTDGRTPALLHVSGTAFPANGLLDLDLSTHGASPVHWGWYLAQLDWLRWTGGTVDGDVHLLVSPSGGGDMALDYRAALQMHNGRAVLLPQQITVSGIEGPLVLDNRSVLSDGLAEMVDTSPVWVRGEVTTVADAHLNLAVRSTSLELATLKRLFFPAARVQISGRVGGEAWVVGSVDTPQVDGTISRGAGRIADEPFTDLSTQMQLSGGVLVFNDFDAVLDRGKARGYGRLALPTGEFAVLADLDRVNARVARALGLVGFPVKGETSGFIAAAGRPGAVIGQARLSLTRGEVAGMIIDRADAVFGFDRGAVEVDRFDARSGPGAAHATGTVARSGSMDLALVATDINLQPIGELLRSGRWLAGTADLDGHIVGTVDAPVVAGRLDARDGHLGPFPFDRATGQVRIGRTGLQTPGLVLRDGEGRYDAVGEVQWGPPEHLDLSIQARRIPAQRLLDIAKVPLDVAGTVEGSVGLTGTFSDPQATGSVVLTDGLLLGQRVNRGVASFHWTSSQLHLDDAVLEVNASRIALRGSVDAQGQLALSFAATGLDLRDVSALRIEPLRVEGAVDLQGTLGGSLTDPIMTTTLSSTTLQLNGQRVDRVEGNVRYQRSRFVLAPLSLLHDAGTLQLSGSVLLGEDPILDLHASIQDTPLSALLGWLRIRPAFALDGSVDGEISASGRISNPNAALALQLTDGVAGDTSIREAAINATVADRAVTVRSFSISPEQGTLIGAGHIAVSGSSELEVRGYGLSLDLLRARAGTGRPLRGELEFTLQLSGALADPLVGMSATVTDGIVGGASFDRMVLQAYFQRGLLHVEQGLVQQDRHKVKVSGTLPIDLLRLAVDDTRPVDLAVSLVDADLATLSALTDRIEHGEGPLAGEIHLTGTMAQPHLEGMLAASGGTLQLRGVAPALTDLQARLEFADAAIRVAQLQAKVGGGTLAVSGIVGLQRFRPDQVALTLEARGAHLQYAPYLDGFVDGVLRLDGPVARPAVSGSLAFSRGDLSVLSVEPQAVPSADAFDPVLNVEVSSGDELWMNLGRLRLQLQGTVQSTGTWVRPKLDGEVQSGRGTFAAFNTTFTLTEGRATFAEFRGTTPYVDARAETTIQVTTVVGTGSRVDPVRIFLHIYGTPDDLVVDLTSDPSLTREEILAGLAWSAGVMRQQRGAQVENVVQVERVLRAEVSAAVFGSMGPAMARAFGLEEFAIAYEVERPLPLRLGKALIRTLYVTLTSEFGVNPRYIWSLENRFTPTMMLSFSVDNQGTYDVLYRITYRF